VGFLYASSDSAYAGNTLGIILQPIALTKRFTQTAIPLRSIAAGELCRYAKKQYLYTNATI